MGGAPAARPGRAGVRPGQARTHARDPRHEPVRAGRVRQPGARLRQLRDPRPGRDRRPEGAVAAPAAGGRPALGVLDDRARQRGQRPDAAADPRRRGLRRLGDQRPQVVLDQRLGGRLPDRDGGHRPGSAPLPARVDVHRPGRHAGRHDRARRADDGAPVRALRLLRRARRDPVRGRARAEGRAAGRARRRLPDRAAAARARPHPSLHALARRVAAGVRHAVRARAQPLLARLAAGRQADGAELDRRLGRRRCTPRV